ncbi:MAG: phosphate ABC transporter permease subunit PstC [bacterium]
MNLGDRRILIDRLSGKLMYLFCVSTLFILIMMGFGLYYRSTAILSMDSLSSLLFSSSWKPLKGEFGFFPYIVGSIYVTFVAIAIALPLCLLTSIYLSEYAHKRMRDWLQPLIDLLAGIPSVVYGVWGVIFVVPIVKNYIAPLFGIPTTGYSVLAGGVVLAIMIFPMIIGVSLEVFASVPREVREASLSLGATKWQTVKYAVIRKASPGIAAAVLLGLSRAFGETMAVLMVAGNVAQIPKTIFGPAYPLAALIANNYGEMLSIPLYDSALMFASLVLLIVVLFFNVGARLVLARLTRTAK